MDKPKINIFQGSSFMEILDSSDAESKGAVLAAAYVYYQDIFLKSMNEVPHKDLPLWINELRMFLLAAKNKEPEMYSKAIDMLSEEELRKVGGIKNEK